MLRATANSLANNFLTKTTDYTFTVNDSIVYVNCASGNVTITLPLANIHGTTQSWRLTVKRVDSSANVLTVNTSGTDTIDGATSTTISALAAKDFASNGINPAGDWKVI